MSNTIRDFKYDLEALDAFKAGVDKLANAVKVTLGPKGYLVCIQAGGNPRLTKDGYTVAKSIALEDQFEHQGAMLALEVASKTNDNSGDGTTTATVLAQAILDEGVKAIKNGANRVDLKTGIELATKAVIKHLKDSARQINTREQVMQVATIASNGDTEISSIIADAIDVVGERGVITHQTSNNVHTSLEIVTGFQFAKGYHSPMFCNDPNRPICELTDVCILVTDKKVNYQAGILPYIQAAADKRQSLLIIADEIEGEGFALIEKVAMSRGMGICAVKAPAHGELRQQLMQDISILTGAIFVSHARGDKLDNGKEASRLGYAKRVIIKHDSTTIIDGLHNPESFQKYCENIMTTYEEEVLDENKAILKERHSRLTKGVANIKIGGRTESEVLERKDRVEDALNAAIYGKQMGILPGGGIALLRASTKAFENLKGDNDDQALGIKIVQRAISVPLKQLILNAGKAEGKIFARIEEATDLDFGWDASKDTFGNMYTMGIIDPLRIVTNALEGAASIACLVITTSVIIVDKLVIGQSGHLTGQIIA